MPHSKQKSRSAPGGGTIRKKTVTRNGTEYTYWEARFTTGFDPATGKQKQRSITGKTQKEVAQKLRQATTEIDQGTYQEPCRMTMREWLEIWQRDYLEGVKPRTKEIYDNQTRNHILPALGAVKLDALAPHDIQQFLNHMSSDEKLAPKTVKMVHGILHKALQQAVAIGYLRFNPASACKLPRAERKELKPLDEDDIGRFLSAAQGHPLEYLFLVTLFTGMRQGEVRGLTWDCVDFAAGTILINKQLERLRTPEVGYYLTSTKNGKGRKLTPAPFVMTLLKKQRAMQNEARLLAGPAWQPWNNAGLVFTDPLGGFLPEWTVYRSFKRLAAQIGRPDARFHDLRHSYAVAAIKSGDDIKTVQNNLGHATAAFTLDVYGHVTEQMKRESVNRMEAFIRSVSCS